MIAAKRHSTPEIKYTRAVISAVWYLHGDLDRGPTATEIATYLKLDEPDVLTSLRDLKDQRIFADRRTMGRRVWEPWGGNW